MKLSIALAFAAVLSGFAAQAAVPVAAGLRPMLTLPAGTVITIGKPQMIVANTKEFFIGPHCKFTFDASASDRVISANTMTKVSETTSDYGGAFIFAKTPTSTNLNLYCTSNLTFDALQTELANVGGSISLPAPSIFGASN